MKFENESEATQSVGNEVISRIADNDWLIQFPANGAQYRMRGATTIEAEGTLSAGDIFRFRFHAEDGRWRFETFDRDDASWARGKNELFIRAEGEYDTSGNIPDQCRGIILAKLVQFRQRSSWLFFPP